jgi:UDP-N-acetylmuramoyl-L-alanine---L-glutamate ligase
MNQNLELLRKNWLKKKILILGFAREGKDALNFLRKVLPGKKISIADEKQFPKKLIKDKNLDLYSGKNYLKSINNHDLIIKSPGIPIHLPEIEKAYQQKKITCSTEIFFDNCQGLIIGVTGTKGKGTTCLMIQNILEKNNIKTYLIGNIGQPGLNYLFSEKQAENVFLYELSSHQLYNLKKSPQIAVFLNVFKDHLDYYQNFQEYVKAKANLVLHQKKQDYLIYNSQDKTVSKIAEKSKAFKFAIKGKDYQLNENAALKVSEMFKIDSKKAKQALENFVFANHRIEKVGSYKKITFYNDSGATIPEATEAAISFLGDKIETIILGGSEKNIDFSQLARKILKTKIKNLIFFPTTGSKINYAIVRQNLKKKKFNKFFVNNMKQAVLLAYQKTNPGKICLLSPASASFGIFKDYQQRGDLFKKYVKLFAQKLND